MSKSKKVLSIILSLIVLWGNGISIYAADKDLSLPVGYVTLTNDQGLVYKINIYPQNRLKNSVNDGSFQYMASTDQMEIVRMPKGSMSDDTWDVTTSVQFFMTINYSTQSNPSTIRLDSVSGSMNVNQTDLTISNQKLGAQCSNPAVVQQSIWKYPTGQSFSYSTGFQSFVPAEDSFSSVGSTWSGTITRGSSWDWNFYLYRYGL